VEIGWATEVVATFGAGSNQGISFKPFRKRRPDFGQLGITTFCAYCTYNFGPRNFPVNALWGTPPLWGFWPRVETVFYPGKPGTGHFCLNSWWECARFFQNGGFFGINWVQRGILHNFVGLGIPDWNFGLNSDLELWVGTLGYTFSG